MRVGDDVGVNVFAKMESDRAAARAGVLGIVVRDRGYSGKVGKAHGNRSLAFRVRSTRQGDRIRRGLKGSRQQGPLGMSGPVARMLAAVNFVESLQQVAAER